MAKVRGTMDVQVNISKREAFNALVEEMGLAHCITSIDRDEYWKVEDGVLRCYEDKSYHGSGHYERSSVRYINDPKKVRAYELLCELQDLV